MDSKNVVETSSIPLDIELDTTIEVSESRVEHKEQLFGGQDELDLVRIGKKPVLKRNFGILSILGFSCTVLGTWEGVLATFLASFYNGGQAGTVWGFIFVWIGTLSVFASIGEMASMAPTSGGQYHWVSILAPQKSQRFLSYITGWLTFAGWQAQTAATAFLVGTIVQGIIVMCTEMAYTPTAWQSVLFYWAALAIAVFFNTIAGPLLAKFEGMILVLHITGFFAILVPLVYLAPHGSATEVFTSFLNNGNWPSQGVSFLVGLSGAVFPMIGADSAVHMAEEIRNAGIVVPRALVWSILINGVLGFAMVLAVLFCLGDVDQVLAAQMTYGYPFLEIFLQGVHNIPGAAVMAAIVTTLGLSSHIGSLASASRQLWAFSRDRGIPFWRTVSQVNTRTSIPNTAISITVAISVLLSFIILGSSTVFNQVLSLTVVGLYSSYFLTCALLLWRRCTGAIKPYSDSTTAIGPGRLSWGRWRVPGPEVLGVANNAFACCYMIVVLIFSVFPPMTPTSPETMNYAALVFGATIIFSVIWYFVTAKKTYTGPVREVQLKEFETTPIGR